MKALSTDWHMYHMQAAMYNAVCVCVCVCVCDRLTTADELGFLGHGVL